MHACEKYEDLLQQYLDKALDSAQTAVLMSHLEVCAACRRDYKLYSKVVEGLEHLEELAPPGRLTSDVMAQLGDLPMAGSYGSLGAIMSARQPAPWLYGLSSATALGIAVAAFFIFKAGSPTSVPSPEMIAMQDRPPAITVPALGIDEPAAPVRTAGPRIMLTVSSGQVQVQRVNSTKWEQIANAAEVAYGDKIRTMGQSNARIEYTQDKTMLKLKPGSLVQILANAVRVFHGDTWIRVDKVGSHFQAETPNAVASVRGTRYSAEVRYPEKIAKIYEGDLEPSGVVRKFVDNYKKALTNERFNGLMPLLAYPMHATPVSLAVQVNMLLDGLDATREAKTNVQVFESKVNVASIDPTTKKELESVLVKEGHQTAVTNMQLAKLAPMVADDFVKWNLPVNQQVLERAKAEYAAGSVATDAAGASFGQPAAQPAATSQPTAETGWSSEAIDRSNPGYDGVERRR